MRSVPVGMTPDQVARHLGVSANTVRQWVRLGKLKGFRVGSRLRIRPEDVQAFVEAGLDMEAPAPHGHGNRRVTAA